MSRTWALTEPGQNPSLGVLAYFSCGVKDLVGPSVSQKFPPGGSEELNVLHPAGGGEGRQEQLFLSISERTDDNWTKDNRLP